MLLRSRFSYRSVFTILVLVAAIYLLLVQLKPLPFEWELLNPSQPWLIVAALSLMPLNWWLETRKWSKLTGLGMYQSSKGVLAGVSIGLFTINRIGEGVGKYFFREDLDKSRFGKAFVAGSMGQFATTVFFGILALLVIPAALLEELSSWAFSELGKFWLIALLLVGLGLIAFLKVKKAKYWPARKQWVWGMGYSTLRYLVFSFQYVLILLAFGVALEAQLLWMCVALVYLVNTLFPSTVLGELGVREAVSLLIIGSFVEAGWEVAAAGLCIWLINLLFPGLLGAWLLWGKYRKNSAAA